MGGLDDIWDELELSDDENNDIGGDGDNQGDDDDNEEEDTYGAAQHVLVVLDCSTSMWKKFLPNPKNYIANNNNDEKMDSDNDNDSDDDDDDKYISPMDQALQVLYDLVRQQVRIKGTGGRGLGSTRDGFGIILFNTKNRHQRLVSNNNGYTTATTNNNKDDNDNKDNDDLNYKREGKSTVHQLVPLSKPNVTTIMTIRATMKDVLGERDLDLEIEYAPTDNDDDNNDNNDTNPLYQALDYVRSIYKEAKCVRQKLSKEMIKMDQKHVWIFTNNDNSAVADASSMITQVSGLVKDMIQADYKISLWPFPKPPPESTTTKATPTLQQQQQEFCYHLFYDKISGVDFPFRKQQEQKQKQQQQQNGSTGSKQKLLQQKQQQQQQDLRDLVRDMMSKWTKVRARFHGLPLTFPNLAGVASNNNTSNNKDDSSAAPLAPTHIAMDWYYMVQVHKEPTPINIHIQDGEPLQTVKQLVTKDDHDNNAKEILVETIRGPGAAAYLRQQELEGRDQAAKWRAGKRRLFSYVSLSGSGKKAAAAGGAESVPMSVQDRNDILQACNRQATNRHFTLIGFHKMPTTLITAGGSSSSTSTNNNIPLTWYTGKSYLCLPADLSSGSDKINSINTKASSTSVDSGNKKRTNSNSNKDDEINLTAFAQLHASMLRKKVWALCELLTSVKTSQSRLAALWPLERQQASGDNDDDDDDYYDEARHPPGMLVIPLPFADELKEPPLDKTDAPMMTVAAAPDSAVTFAAVGVKMKVENQQLSTTTTTDYDDAAFKAAVDLVKKLKFQEGTELGVNFDNVRLARFWNHIEQVALELPAVNKETNETNETKIDPEAILKRAGREIQAFSDSLPEDVKVEKAGKANKKKALPIDEVGDLKEYFRGLYQADELKARTVADIKKFLAQEGYKTSGKKQDLINRVAEIFEEEQNVTNGKVRVKQEDDDEMEE